MKKIKDEIPTVDRLKLKFHTIMESGLTDFVKTTNARRIAVRASIRFAIISVLFILAISVFLFMAQVDITTVFGKIIVMTALLWATVLLISGRSWFVGSTLLAREINMALVPILATAFERSLLYTYNEGAVDAVTELLNESSLLEEEVTNLRVENVYTVFCGFDMRAHDVVFDKKADSPDSKKTSVSATFIDVNLPNEHAAATLLTTTGQSFGLSQQSQVQHMQNNQSFHSVELVDEHFKAFSTDPAAGSNFLTKELLQVMSDWKADTKVNIRVMRKGTKLFILVPARKKSTTYTSTSTKPEAIERYAGVVARPIWRALMVAEEVRE
jgi:hypothetical protein